MNDNANKFIEEIISVHRLEEHAILLTSIVKEISCENIKLYTRYDGGPNTFTFEGNVGPEIRISIGHKRNVAITIIWDLLHEYGHFLSGEKLETQTKRFREVFAWEIASTKLNHFKIPKNLQIQFQDFRKACLKD